MTLIVEDGSGKTDAESYVSVADCVAYANKFGLEFTQDLTQQEPKLRRATQYIDANYSFKGQVEHDTQSLAWPRDVASGVIPKEVMAACCELACKPDDLWQDVDSVAVISETVGPLSTTYAQPINGGQVRFAGVDALLSKWVAGNKSIVFLQRA